MTRPATDRTAMTTAEVDEVELAPFFVTDCVVVGTDDEEDALVEAG